mmetsp:Transcript_33382/g.76212  ORF Transcript_33382/g.76212 Transcript_33382/m.76212 type:complete len:1066 (+) Transcript_33382:37-3234(+)
MARPEDKTKKTCVVFRWACEQLAEGEAVAVVGNCEELGNWNPEQGYQLELAGEATKDATSFSVWTDPDGIELPLRLEVHYKYVVCEKSTGKAVRWEPMEGNRSIVLTGRRLVIEDDDGLCRTLISNGQSKPGVDDRDAEAAKSQGAAMGREESKRQRADTFDGSPKGVPSRLSRTGTAEMSQMLTKDDTVLMVFKTLPIGIEKDPSAEDGWRTTKVDPFTNVSATTAPLINLALMKESLKEEKKYKVKIVGQPNVMTKDPQEQQKIAKVYASFNCYPVFVEEDVDKNHVSFCHTFLWPLINNVKAFEGNDSKAMFSEAAWKEYQKFNRAYADVVEAQSNSSTLIWIHNYYLLMLPRLLYLRRPDSTIGFFMHCPFPNSEVFRCVPVREEILQSLLSCKVVGFQIFEYARHFLTCCSHVFGATHSFQEGGILQVEHESRSTVIRADHVVIPFQALLLRMERPDIKKRTAELAEQYKGITVIGSIDNIGSFAGLIHKLRAFKRFVVECTDYREKVSLYQYVIVRDHDEAENKALLKELNSMADEINKISTRKGKPPMVKIDTGVLTVDEQLATLQAMNILLDTSTKDGLNLMPFMFYLSHTEDKSGVVIVSEFSGCSSVLPGALQINPWHTQAVVEALSNALTMDPKQRDANFQRDHSYVASQTLEKWLNQNLAELKREGHERVGPVRGLDADFRMLIMERGFVRLDAAKVVRDYRRARTRAIFLDNEGTLMLTGAQTDLAGRVLPPPASLLSCLRTLALSKGNTVCVLSGRSKQVVDGWFGGVEALGLCAELGFYWVPPGKSKGSSGERWRCTTTNGAEEDGEWKAIVSELMSQYVRRVQGTVMENKGSAITWIYRYVGEPQVVKQIALELIRFLDPTNQAGLLYGYPVKVVHGRGYVEVRRNDVDKGVAVSRFLTEMRLAGHKIDFVLCIGNDRSDEDMFEVVNASEDASRKPAASTSKKSISRSRLSKAVIEETPALHPAMSRNLEDIDAIDQAEASGYYTATVGRKPSKAKFYIRDVTEVNELLGQLSLEESISGFRGHCSMPNFDHLRHAADEEEEDEDENK